MALTPLDIQHKEFTVKMKGYKKEQVDNFLQEIKNDYEKLLKEKREIQKQLEFSEEKNKHFKNLQDTLNKSIVVAQDAADRLKENARKEAEIILFEAEKSADHLLKDAAGKATKINQETDIVRKESKKFKQKLNVLVETQLDLIQNEEWNSLLNATTERELKTPTLNEVLLNRAHKAEDSVEESDETEKESASVPVEKVEEGKIQNEAVEISI